MTRLIDVYTPQHDVSDTLVFHVDATPANVLAAADRHRPEQDAFAGVKVLAVTGAQRVFQLAFQPRPGSGGDVDVVFDVRIESDGDGGCYVSSTRRFTATSDAARQALRTHWRTVHANADTIARQTLRAIKRTAEDAPARAGVPHLVEVALAA